MFPRHDMHVAGPGGAPVPHCAQCSPKKPNYAPAGLYGCMAHGWPRVKALAGPGKLWTLARVPRRYSPALLRVSPRDENMGSGQARTCQAQDTSRFGPQLGLSNII